MPSVPFAFHALCRRNYFSYQFVDAKKSWVVQKTQIQVKLPCLTPFRLLSHTPRSRPESLSDQNHYLKAGTLCCCSSVLNLLCIWSNSPFFFSSWLCITDRLGGKQRPGQQEEGTRWGMAAKTEQRPLLVQEPAVLPDPPLSILGGQTGSPLPHPLGVREVTLPSVWGCPLGLECHSSSCPPLFLPPCPRPLTPFKSGEEKSPFLLGPRSILGVVLAEAAAVEYEKSWLPAWSSTSAGCPDTCSGTLNQRTDRDCPRGLRMGHIISGDSF